MKVSELIENAAFKESDFVDRRGNKAEINYDLVDDVVHFMNNDDSAYRRYLYPAIIKFERSRHSKSASSTIFQPVVMQAYQEYANMYPIRELPDELPAKMCKMICDKLLEQIKATSDLGN